MSKNKDQTTSDIDFSSSNLMAERAESFKRLISSSTASNNFLEV